MMQLLNDAEKAGHKVDPPSKARALTGGTSGDRVEPSAWRDLIAYVSLLSLSRAFKWGNVIYSSIKLQK